MGALWVTVAFRRRSTERQSNRTIPRNNLVCSSEVFQQPETVFASESKGACALASTDVATAKSDPLAAFSPPTRAWFEASFAEPTPAQAKAWPAIASGEHVLLRPRRGRARRSPRFCGRWTGWAHGLAPAKMTCPLCARRASATKEAPTQRGKISVRPKMGWARAHRPALPKIQTQITPRGPGRRPCRLHLASEGPVLRHRAQPACAAPRYRGERERWHPHGRHLPGRTRCDGAQTAGDLDHDSGVAVSDPRFASTRHAGHGRDGDRR